MDLDPKALQLFRAGYDKILEGLAQLGDDAADENFIETAARAAKGFHELVLSNTGVKAEISELLTKTFPARYGEMVISKHNTAFGVCPHHLLPSPTSQRTKYLGCQRCPGSSDSWHAVPICRKR
jgi:GTP cyclohydrolase I